MCQQYEELPLQVNRGCSNAERTARIAENLHYMLLCMFPFLESEGFVGIPQQT